MNIGKFDRRVTVSTTTNVVDAGGGVSKSALTSWELWANIEDKSGGLSNTEGQRMWSYDTVIRVRYDSLKPIKSNYTITYETFKYVINSITVKSEGKKQFVELRCSKNSIES